MSLLIIDRETVRALLPMKACIALMGEAMTALSVGATQQRLRQIIPLAGGSAFGIMPGATADTFGAKLISVFPGNFAKGLQSHQGVVVIFDPDSGAPVAILHAGEITAIRTAAASAAATDVLARTGAHRLAILGYGEQALAHARAMMLVRPIAEIRLWGRSPDRARDLARRLEAELERPVSVSPTARHAVTGADIVCAVSGAAEPILLGEWIADGVHVNLVGSGGPVAREVDDALVVRARVFADHRPSVLAQGAEVLHAIEGGLIDESHVLGEIGEVMSGARPGRLNDTDVTAYKSLGTVVQDLASGWRVYRAALAEGRGVTVEF